MGSKWVLPEQHRFNHLCNGKATKRVLDRDDRVTLLINTSKLPSGVI